MAETIAEGTEKTLAALELHSRELQDLATDRITTQGLQTVREMIESIRTALSEQNFVVFADIHTTRNIARNIASCEDKIECSIITKKIEELCDDLDKSMLEVLPRKLQPELRQLIVDTDMPEVLEIENMNFESPWPKEDFMKLHRNSITKIASLGKRIVGFTMFEFQKEHFQILNFAVHPTFVRRGIGTKLIEKIKHSALDMSGKIRIKHFKLEVRETNLRAQLFFKNMGFKGIDVLRNFYTDCDEDAYDMKYTLTDDEISRMKASHSA